MHFPNSKALVLQCIMIVITFMHLYSTLYATELRDQEKITKQLEANVQKSFEDIVICFNDLARNIQKIGNEWNDDNSDDSDMYTAFNDQEFFIEENRAITAEKRFCSHIYYIISIVGGMSACAFLWYGYKNFKNPKEGMSKKGKIIPFVCGGFLGLLAGGLAYQIYRTSL